MIDEGYVRLQIKWAKEPLERRIKLLEDAIRKHRDSWLNGDDKCWKDNVELYQLLPEGFTLPETDELVEIEYCQKYIKSCHHPDIVYVSPQRRIEELEEQLKNERNQSHS